MYQNTIQVEKKEILLMITDCKKWHYLFVKKLSALLNKITCNYEGGFYCFKWFLFF